MMSRSVPAGAVSAGAGPRLAGPALAGLLLAIPIPALATPAHAATGVSIASARLHTPPDSHEPQRAMLELRNAGTAPAGPTAFACAFLGEGGAVLETGTGSLAALGPAAAAQAEIVYYGWPRARDVFCRLTGADPAR